MNLTLITLGLLLWISLPSTSADIENDVYGPKLVIRTPRAISGLFKRFFGRRKQSGFQGTAQTQQPYNVAASTYYPAFVQSAFPVIPFQGPSAFAPAVATGGYPYHYPAHFTGFEGYTPLAQASSIYPAFSLPNTFTAAQPGLSAPLDFHSYFESLIRPVTSGSSAASAAAAAAGDQETSASTLLSSAVKPDGSAATAATLAQNFKNLYSFPFQLSSEGSSSPTSSETFNLQMPFGPRHTLRRSSQDKISNVGYQIQRLIANSQKPQQHQQTVKSAPISTKSQSVQPQQKTQPISYAVQSLSNDQIKNQQNAYKEQEQTLQNALFNPQEYIAQIIQQELVAQQAQLQAKPDAKPSNDQAVSSSERSTSYYPSSYYYGSGQSLPSAMTKPRATSIIPITKQQPIVTKKSTTASEPSLRSAAKYEPNSSHSSSPAITSSSSSSSSPSSSQVPVGPSSYPSDSYSSRVYKE